MLRKHYLPVLITLFSVFLIAFLAFMALGLAENDFGGNVKIIDDSILDFSLLVGSDLEFDFSVLSSPGFGTTTAQHLQDSSSGGRITLKFPMPEMNKLIIRLEDSPKATKRFFISVRTENGSRDFSAVTSQWNYKLPMDVSLCFNGVAKNIKQLSWASTTQIDSQIIYIPPSLVITRVPVVIVKPNPNTENRCRAATWTQILAGKEEQGKNVNSDSLDTPCNIKKDEPEVLTKVVVLYKENPCRFTTWTQIIAGKEETYVDPLQGTIPK